MAESIVFSYIPPDILRALRTMSQEEVDAAAAEHDAYDLSAADRRLYKEEGNRS